MSATAKQFYRFLVDAVSTLSKKSDALHQQIHNLDQFALDCKRQEERLDIALRKRLLPDDMSPDDYFTHIDKRLGFGCYKLREAVVAAQAVISEQSGSILPTCRVEELNSQYHNLIAEFDKQQAQNQRLFPTWYDSRFLLEQRIADVAQMVLKKKIDNCTIERLYTLSRKWKITRLFLGPIDCELLPLADKFVMYHHRLMQENGNPRSFYTPEDDNLPPADYRVTDDDTLEDIVAKVKAKVELSTLLKEQIKSLMFDAKAIRKNLDTHEDANTAVNKARQALKPHNLWAYLHEDIRIANGFQKAFDATDLGEHKVQHLELQLKKALYEQSAKGLKQYKASITGALFEYKDAKEKWKHHRDSTRTISGVELKTLNKDLTTLITSSERVLAAATKTPRRIERSYQQYRQQHSYFDFALLLPIFIAADAETQEGNAIIMQESGITRNHVDSPTLSDIPLLDVTSVTNNLISNISNASDACSYFSSSSDFGSTASVSVDVGGGF